ncbi:hypothetical protein P692DRAFT_201805113 [Suillus brevipes Sb2]|nr:hypothetical protein P692DRAFT_201805113 [Suillus brevipes Sb2]
MVCMISTPFMRESSSCWMKYHNFHASMAGSWLGGQNLTEATSVLFGVEWAAHGTKAMPNLQTPSTIYEMTRPWGPFWRPQKTTTMLNATVFNKTRDAISSGNANITHIAQLFIRTLPLRKYPGFALEPDSFSTLLARASGKLLLGVGRDRDACSGPE